MSTARAAGASPPDPDSSLPDPDHSLSAPDSPSAPMDPSRVPSSLSASDATRPAISVVVLADPGRCTLGAQSVQDRLREELARVFGSAEVSIRSTLLGISEANTLELSTPGSVRRADDSVDVVLMLTEMPRRSDGVPMIAEVFIEQVAAVVSYPVVGVLSSKKRLTSVFMACVLRLTGSGTVEDHARYTLPWNEWTPATEDHGDVLRAHTITGVPRTVLGMVVTNAPWRAAPKLSSALAAASATGAFGIFYSNIWEMSAALSTPRLLMIGLLAMSLMVVWLTISGGLWERAEHENPAAVHLYYNLSTVLTLFLSVLGLYLAMVVLILLSGLVVIDPEFMEGVIGQPATLERYLDIAWLSAALGVVAGGLGATFDDETDLRSLTHGRREALRRKENREER